MAKSYQQLQTEIELLQKKAETLRIKEMADVVKELKQTIAHWGLTAEDLGLQGATGGKAASKTAGRAAGKAAKKAGAKAATKAAGKAARKTTTKAASKKSGGRAPRGAAAEPKAVKYQDGNGNVWGGRGPRPTWVKTALESGRTLEEFAAS